MNEITQKKNREILAKTVSCREFLYHLDFITDSESEKIHQKIMKWKKRNMVSISREQIESVNMFYDDNPGPFTWDEIQEYINAGYKVRHGSWEEEKFIARDSEGYYDESCTVGGKYVAISKEIDNRGWFVIHEYK